MSEFAAMVRRRVGVRATAVRSPGDALVEGISLVHGLVSSGRCPDARCSEVLASLELATRGTPADARTALTRLQALLRSLTEEDADVAADGQVQGCRRALHLLLDH